MDHSYLSYRSYMIYIFLSFVSPLVQMPLVIPWALLSGLAPPTADHRRRRRQGDRHRSRRRAACAASCLCALTMRLSGASRQRPPTFRLAGRRSYIYTAEACLRVAVVLFALFFRAFFNPASHHRPPTLHMGSEDRTYYMYV